MGTIAGLLILAALLWALTRLHRIAEETARTRAILAALHDHELSELARRALAQAEHEPDNRKRQALIDRADRINRTLRWP